MNQTVKCYDNGGKTIDRYTAVFQVPIDGEYHYIGMSANPYSPQGFGQHGSAKLKPSANCCGRKVELDALPIDCRRLIAEDLAEYNQMLAAL